MASADNNQVSISKDYQLFPKQKLVQTNSLVTSTALLKFTDIISLCIGLQDAGWSLVHHLWIGLMTNYNFAHVAKL